MKKARKKVIIDTDVGWDDVLSLCYLMKNPAIEIVGVSVTGCGETDLRWGSIIAKTLMELGNQTNAKVAIGADKPLKYDHKFPQDFKNDMNDIMGLLGTLNPKTKMEFDKRKAWKFLADTINESKEKITILSLGGFTNIAKMLDKYKIRTENIEQIYAMAGAVYVDGNVAALNNANPKWNQGPIYSTNYVAEWNVFVDPLAAKKVIHKSKIPTTIIPLDACDYVVLDPSYVKTITATDPIANLVRNIFIKKTGSYSEGIPVPIFDPLATMIMAGDLPDYQYHKKYLNVNTSNSLEDNKSGKLSIVKKARKKTTIVQGVSQRAFALQFANIINR